MVNFSPVKQVNIKGRWYYTRAAGSGIATILYERYCESLAGRGVPVERGIFAARMAVGLVNDGPVTIWLESPNR